MNNDQIDHAGPDGTNSPVHSGPAGPCLREPTLLFAGFWWRCLAAQIDLILIALTLSLFLFVIEQAQKNFGVIQSASRPELWGWLLVSWLYYAGMECSRWHGTFGKMLFGLTVVDLAGKPITFMRASVRHVLRVLFAIPGMIGFMLVAVSARKQGAHDWLTRVLVVRSANDGSATWPWKFLRADHRIVVFRHANKLAAIAAVLLLLLLSNIASLVIQPLADAMTAQLMVQQSAQKMLTLQPAIGRVLQTSGHPPPILTALQNQGLYTPSGAHIAYNDRTGALKVTFSNNSYIDGASIDMVPSLNQGQIKWSCKTTGLVKQLVPPGCDG